MKFIKIEINLNIILKIIAFFICSYISIEFIYFVFVNYIIIDFWKV